MNTLHLISTSPFSTNHLAECLKLIGCEEDESTASSRNSPIQGNKSQISILLLEDGIYGALDCKLNIALYHRQKKHHKGNYIEPSFYLLEADAIARGIVAQRRLQFFDCIDYDRFVGLCCTHSPVVSW